MGDAREILTFSWLDEVQVLKDFIRDFYLWKLICEIGVKFRSQIAGVRGIGESGFWSFVYSAPFCG
jgi:hypothetical protein